MSREEVEVLSEECRITNQWYSFFVNIISIFPLLGILGTVLALITLVGDSSSEMTQQGFFAALTSTAWGVFCAMVFKVGFDARIAPRIEKINSDVARKLKQYESEPSEVENEEERDSN